MTNQVMTNKANILLQNATVFVGDHFVFADVLLKDGIIVAIGTDITIDSNADITMIDSKDFHILPGFADVHVHLREPGFLYKETIATGTAAAAKGGFTLLCSMPNLNPVPDTVENIELQHEVINIDSKITVLPYAAITKGELGSELVDMEALSPLCIGFSDDGKGVQSDDMMREAMRTAKKVGRTIVAHCEDESLLHGGYIHDGKYAKLHGHKGISSASEYKQVERDIHLVRETGVQYHICHISTKETVELVRQAKQEGLPITCETAPHYLAFCDMDLQEDGRFKMNPPIRSKADQEALIQGIKDGTIDAIATDHAPHSQEEKSRGLAGSAMGVVGIETAFGAMYTYMVETGQITLEELAKLMSIAPRKIFGLDHGIKIGELADLTIVDTQKKYIVDPENFLSKGRATPFSGKELTGEVWMTIAKGEIVWQKNLTKN
ncbi:MAG: dihydroorotase [Bacillota bacterium]